LSNDAGESALQVSVYLGSLLIASGASFRRNLHYLIVSEKAFSAAVVFFRKNGW
jgi:hypothetical protein